MTVDDAIKAYQQLAGKVFSNVKWITSDGKFKATELEKAFKGIVKSRTHDEGTRLLDDSMTCKVYVPLPFRVCGTLLSSTC